MSRTGSVPLDTRMLVAMAVAVPFFFPGIFSGRLPGPFALGLTDTFVFFEPYALEFTRALSAGANPFWSHTSAFGSPTLLSLGTGALHPFHLFHLGMPDWLAFAVGWWARLILGGSYLYLYLRLQNVSPWIALTFSQSFLFGGFHLNYSSEIIGYVMCFFPMLLYYADRICRLGDRRPTSVLLLAAATLGMLLGGFLSVILYLCLAAGVYMLLVSTSWRALLIAGLACTAGVLIGTPAIVETLAFYPGTGYDPAQRAWLYAYDPPPITAINLVIPSVFGNLTEYRAAGMRDFFGSQLGAGLLTFPLALLSLLALRLPGHDKRPLLFWTATLVLCLALYFNVLGIKQWLAHVPVINEHPFTRLQTLIALGSSIAAAIALDRLLSSGAATKRLTAWLLMGLALSMALVYAFTWQRFAHLDAGWRLVVFGALCLSGLASLVWALRQARPAATVVFACVCALGSVATSVAFSTYYRPADYYPDTPVIQAIKDQLAPGAKVLDIDNHLFRGGAIAHGIPSVTNHWFSQPALRQWVQQLSATKKPQGLTFDTLTELDAPEAWQSLRDMHVQFVVFPRHKAPPDHPPGAATPWARVSEDGRSVLVEVLGNGRPWSVSRQLDGAGYAQYQEGEGRIRFLASSPRVTLPVRYDPGWTSDTPAVSLNRDAMNRLVVTTEGAPTRVSLSYRPASLMMSLWAGVLASLTVLGVVFLLLKAPGRQASPPSPHVPTPPRKAHP